MSEHLEIGQDEARAVGSIACAIDLNAQGQVPDWIHVLPAGPAIVGRDGRAWRLSDPEAVVAASMSEGDELLVDIDHAADGGSSTRAAGWIKELQARPDGIWARVEWTDLGRKVVAAREYRFVSPVFFYRRGDAEKHILRIGGVSLTNKPNLHLKSLNREGKAIAMEEAWKALCAALGIDPEETDQDAAIETIKALKTQAEEQAQMMKAIAAALGVEDADQEKILAAIQEREKKPAASEPEPDPAKYAPVSVVKELQQELNSLKEAVAGEKAAAAVDAAIKDGRLTPAQREWAVAYCKADPDGFTEFVRAQPIIVGGRVAPQGQDGGAALTPEEKAICRAMGIDEKDFLATKKAREQHEEAI